jgi:hypothetical protein
MHSMQAAISKFENSAQVFSYQLKFVHGFSRPCVGWWEYLASLRVDGERNCCPISRDHRVGNLLIIRLKNISHKR